MQYPRISPCNIIAIVRLAVLCGAFVSGGPVQAAQHLVRDPTQLNAALASAVPGDRIVMANGVWRDQKIVFRSKGTASQPITLSF